MRNDPLNDRAEKLRLERRRIMKREDNLFALFALLATLWAMAMVSLVFAAAYWLATR